ncbi:MAG TPA: hypothetical protein VF765_15190 [Polyangiaceae bacterium]
MKSTVATVLFSAGLALAAVGCGGGVGGSTEGSNGAPGTKSIDPQQQRLASATLALEMAYDVQFVKGQVDRQALEPLIYDVLQSMPDDKRSQAQAHIYDVISRGERDASAMTPEQRAQVAAPVSADKMGSDQVDIIGAWGWGMPAFGGFGVGLGFPGAGLGWGGLGWGGGWGTTAAWGTTTTFATAGFGFPGWGGVGWGAGWVPGWGAAGWTPALGAGWGLGWGGLGAFGFPGCFGFGAGGLGLGGGLGAGVGVPGGWGF